MPTFVRPGLARLPLAALVVLACPVSAAGARVSIAHAPMHRTDSVDDAYDWLVLQLAEHALARPGPTL